MSSSDPQIRSDFLVLSGPEVSSLVLATVAALPDPVQVLKCNKILNLIRRIFYPVQVVFKNQMCLDCGQRGDARY